MPQTQRTLQEFTTTMAAGEVLARAKDFFARRHGIYSTFLEAESATHATFRGQGGEEIVIAVAPSDRGVRVTGSTYLFDAQIARFFATLPAAEQAPPVAVDTAPVAEAGAQANAGTPR